MANWNKRIDWNTKSRIRNNVIRVELIYTFDLTINIFTIDIFTIILEREIGFKPFPKCFWWLKCPTQIIGLTSLL
jgi:hypothetical protein